MCFSFTLFFFFFFDFSLISCKCTCRFRPLYPLHFSKLSTFDLDNVFSSGLLPLSLNIYFSLIIPFSVGFAISLVLLTLGQKGNVGSRICLICSTVFIFSRTILNFCGSKFFRDSVGQEGIFPVFVSSQKH